MKKIFLSLILVLITFAWVMGQRKDTVPNMAPKSITLRAPEQVVKKEAEGDEDNDVPKKDSISYGFHFGGQITNVQGLSKGSFEDLAFIKKNKTGYNFGFYLDIPIVHHLFLQPELNYSEKGYNATGSNVSNPQINFVTTLKYKRTYQFLDLPILFKYYPGKKLFFTAGPQISYLFLVNDQYLSPSAPSAYVVFDQQLTKLRKLVPGINFGMGFKLGETLSLSATYSFDFATNYTFIGGDAPKFYNEYFALRLGYRLSKNTHHKK